MKRLAGVASCTLTGAVLGIGVAKCLHRENFPVIAAVIPLLAGAVSGGVIGYNAAEEADSVNDANRRAAADTCAGSSRVHVMRRYKN